jgi:ParB-like chromosome segregation protein Spo0J
MELEVHQLDLRYEGLRRRSPLRERQLLASLAEIGQQLPIVVVAQPDAGFVVIDGYKRVRALRRLACDRVRSTTWAVAEPDALLLDRMMRCAGENTLEQSWLLAELAQRFALSLEDLARRFDRSKSWVSRRLALTVELPAAIQEQVRAGAIAAHAAMKYLVPLARANAAAAVRLSGALTALKPTTRQVGALYAGWQSGNARTRALIEATPQIFLRAQAEATAAAAQKSPLQQLLDDLKYLAGMARRLRRQLPSGWIAGLADDQRDEAQRLLLATRAELHALLKRCDQETDHAR